MSAENMFDGLTEEQKARARACTSAEELIQLAQDEGLELTDEQLESVAGGYSVWEDEICNGLGNV